MIYVIRAPISIVFLIFLGFMQAFLQASIFHGVGAKDFSATDKALDAEIVLNLLGLSFLVS